MRSGLRATTATRQPSAARIDAAAAPIPWLPPATKAIFPFIPRSIRCSSDPRLSLDKCQRLQIFGCLVKTLDADWPALPIGIGEGGNHPPQEIGRAQV